MVGDRACSILCIVSSEGDGKETGETVTTKPAWAWLVLLSGVLFAIPTGVRLVWAEPFPAVSFPAFAQPATSNEDGETLWLVSPDSEAPFLGEGVRTGSQSQIAARLVDLSAAGQLSKREIDWLERVEGVSPICALELRTVAGPTVVFETPDSGSPLCTK